VLILRVEGDAIGFEHLTQDARPQLRQAFRNSGRDPVFGGVDGRESEVLSVREGRV